MRKSYYLVLGGFLLVMLITTGCIPRYKINTTSMGDPISMTGKQITKNYIIVHHFKKHLSQYWFLGILPINSYDLSENLSDIIHKYNGDGVVNIHFVTKGNLMDAFVPLISLTLVIPTPLEVEGDVIRYVKK